jgi:hypothetical protein
MVRFHLLSRTRQITESSCGACALHAVLSYWGKEVEEEELMRLLGTSAAVGTFPERIVQGVRSLGLKAEARQNLTLDELRKVTDAGHPVIALAQVWRSHISAMEGGSLEEGEDAAEINAALAAITGRSIGGPRRARVAAAVEAAASGDFGLSVPEIRGIASRLPPDHSTIIALREHPGAAAARGGPRARR